MSDTEQAVQNVRPLNATQSRALAKLVDNDFETLKAELEQFADEQREEAERQVRAEHAEALDRARQYEDRARALVVTLDQDIQHLVAEARAEGITLDVRTRWERPSRDTFSANVNNLQGQILDAHGQVNRALNRALNLASRARLDAQRRVLRASLTTEAEQVLDTIPSAADLMRQVREQETASATPEVTR